MANNSTIEAFGNLVVRSDGPPKAVQNSFWDIQRSVNVDELEELEDEVAPPSYTNTTG